MSEVKKPPKQDNKPLQAPAMGTPEADTKAMLDKQKKVSIRLYQTPADSSDDPLPDVFVGINGYSYQLQRGESLEVPESVAEILRQAKHI